MSPYKIVMASECPFSVLQSFMSGCLLNIPTSVPKSHLPPNSYKAGLLIPSHPHRPLRLPSCSLPSLCMSVLVTLLLPGAQARNRGVVLFHLPCTCSIASLLRCPSKYVSNLNTFYHPQLLSGPSHHFSRGLFPHLPYWSF